MSRSVRIVCLIATVAVGACWCHADPYQPRVGQRHADFTLPDARDGKPVSLSRFRGRKLLLIHFAAW